MFPNVKIKITRKKSVLRFQIIFDSLFELPVNKKGFEKNEVPFKWFFPIATETFEDIFGERAPHKGVSYFSKVNITIPEVTKDLKVLRW